ncbi:MAG: D-alanyl-D-alanine carboxypeptidase [Firmicutes bacterium]|nr:D-alanyl-D-alanine carboxypeptidase [Bacillota bacterium]
MNNLSSGPSSGSAPSRRKKKKKYRINKRKLLRAILLFLLLIAALSFGISKAVSALRKAAEEEEQPQVTAQTQQPEPVRVVTLSEQFKNSPGFTVIGSEIASNYSVLINADTKEIIAGKNINEKIYPASMTKVLALLTAAENCTDWSGTVNFSRSVEEYCFVNKCSVVGYERNEVVLLSETPYGTILSSGADATVTMAEHVAGTHEAFVDLMNQTAKSLGLGMSTHFSNSVGIYADDHYTTVRDMAVIMYAAMRNSFCKEVLTTRTFETAPTENHPDGQVLTNLFLLRVGTKDPGSVKVTAAKTGYVGEAGFCAVSYGEAEDGTPYICVTADSTGVWQTVIDHAAIYKNYVPQAEAQ